MRLINRFTKEKLVDKRITLIQTASLYQMIKKERKELELRQQVSIILGLNVSELDVLK